MQGCAERGAEAAMYSTADYCESPDSSRKRPTYYLPFAVQPTRHRANPLPRCLRKQYRWPPVCCHQPRAVHSFPTRRIQKTGGRRMKRYHQLEETTSMDEHKSMTSYSSILTVDVSREMEAVNRDIEEIIRRCDDYCPEGTTTVCKHCCHSKPHRKYYKIGKNPSDEVAKMMSHKRIPMDKIKEIPLNFLKPRPPRQFKEKSLSAPHTKFKTSRDIRNIVEETDALLKNVYRDLYGGKPVEDDDCRCAESPIWGPTCLERYLGCQNKCRRMHENRWFKPKWKDVFEKAEFYKMIKPHDEKIKHFHDTNCLSEPTSPSCLFKTKNEVPQSRPKSLKDAGVNTEVPPAITVQKSNRSLTGVLSDEIYRRDGSPFNDTKKYSVQLLSTDNFMNYISDNMSGRASSEQRRQKSSDFESRSIKKEQDDTLLLDRNMGLTLDNESKLQVDDLKGEFTNSGPLVPNKVSDENPKSPVTYVSHEYFADSPRSGAGDSLSAMETSKALISQIINKIVNKPFDLSTHKLVQTVEMGSYEKVETDAEELDTGMCLEIMRRLVDLMTKHHRKQIDSLREVSSPYARIRKIKQQHLINIDKEINSILDLEFYLRNASPARN